MTTKYSSTLPRSAFRDFKFPVNYRPDVFVKREDIPKAALAAEATTYGWDTVNCIKATIVNNVLKSSDSYPKLLSATLNNEENWKIDTAYGAWQIAQGGSGAILMMHLPLTSATLTYGTDTLSFTNGYALISIKLRYIPQNLTRFTAANDNPIDIEKLIADAEARSGDDPAVVIQRVNYGSATPDEKQKSLFAASIALLLNQNLDKFQHIFAVVNLNQAAAQKEFQWLKPTYTSYAYFQGLDEESSYFAVLNQTGGHSSEGLTNQIAASAIPAGANASILISNGLFLKQMVFPGLVNAFTHADADAFKIVANGQAIENTKKVNLDKVKVAATSYQPKMDYFRLQIVGDEMQIQTKISVHISPGIDAYIDATYFYVIGLGQKSDGTYTLDFEQSGEPLINDWVDVAAWVTWTEVTVALVGAVIGAVVGEQIEQVARKIIIVVLITIVAGILAVVPSLIADIAGKGALNALPSIGPLIDDAASPIDWPKASGFTLKSAELNGAFQLGGLLQMA